MDSGDSGQRGTAVADSPAYTRPAIIVSSDGHIGPRLEQELRAYCPSEHLDEFDAYARRQAELRAAVPDQIRFMDARQLRNLNLSGHHDVKAYLGDMDVEGVAAEVLFQGSQNGHTIPFLSVGAVPSGNPFVSMSFVSIPKRELEMYTVGQEIYDRWLADAVSVAPDRLVGLAQVSFWNIELAARQVAWAHEQGLKGVNFPTPRPGLPSYADPVWDVFWRACEENGMPMTGHGGAGDPSTWEGVHGNAIAAIESPGWNSRRALHFLIFGGVFDRFPNLKLVLTEQPGTWWSYTARDYDSVWFGYDADSAFRKQVPLLPSEYMARNVYLGASFMSFEEAQDAVKHGYVSRVIWGRDYPHAEGTFQAAEFEGDPRQSPLALRDALQGSTADDALAMVGLNGVGAYGLNAERLTKIAEEIGAPSINELRVPPEEIPESHGFLAFRRHGAYS